MILIGTFEWKSTREKGIFTCPECGTRQPYRYRTSRPFLTLYFIPVLPIGKLAEYVECNGCQTVFEPAILQVSNHVNAGTRPSPQPIEEISTDGTTVRVAAVSWPDDLLRAMAAIACEDGNVTEQEIRLARKIYEQLTGRRLSRDRFGEACGEVQLAHLSTSALLRTMAARRTETEKYQLVQAIFALAGASGQLTSGRLAVLKNIPRILTMREEQFVAAVESANQLVD
ncbi:MAG: hypothetical protein KatS3mg111_2593 [Pirellulaceae bacterium]|nr:MAG: hypothetical protein KatS3mg111_2593 [Pirellulaceae bacterium]